MKTQEGKGCAAELLEVHQKSSGTGISLSGVASPSGPTADKPLLGKSLCGCRLFVHWSICGKMHKDPGGAMQDCSSFSSALKTCYILVSILWWQICCNHILLSLWSYRFWKVLYKSNSGRSLFSHATIFFIIIFMSEARSFSCNSLWGWSLCCFWGCHSDTAFSTTGLKIDAQGFTWTD